MGVPPRLRAFGGAAGVLMLLQALSIGLYWAVEHGRAADRPGRPFEHEQLSGAEPASDAALARPDGSELRLSSLRGRAVLLHVWATWSGSRRCPTRSSCAPTAPWRSGSRARETGARPRRSCCWPDTRGRGPGIRNERRRLSVSATGGW